MAAKGQSAGPRPERMLQLVSDPLWKGQPFMLLNLFRFGDDKAAGAAHFRSYLAAAQQFTEKEMGSPWLPGAKLVSLGCRSMFGGSHGAWDAVVMYQYDDPQQLAQLARSRAFAKASAGRVQSVVGGAHAIVAVRAAPVGAALLPGDSARAAAAGARHWDRKVAKGLLAGGEGGPPVIYPKPPDAMALLKDRRFTGDAPVYAINLLRFRRDNGPGSRQHYHNYAGKADPLIKQAFPEPRGMACPLTPVLTLQDDSGTDWDEFAIMEYPTGKAFLKLGQLPEFSTAALKGEREAGLQVQGLVLCRPEIISGVPQPGCTVPGFELPPGAAPPPARGGTPARL